MIVQSVPNFSDWTGHPPGERVLREDRIGLREVSARVTPMAEALGRTPPATRPPGVCVTIRHSQASLSAEKQAGISVSK